MPHMMGRLHVGKKYYYVEYHAYLGPTFYSDYYHTWYDPVDEHDPIWDVFSKWYDKRTAQHEHKHKSAEKRNT